MYFSATIGGLKGDVQVLSGRVKGKTLLPLPPEAEKSPLMNVDEGSAGIE